MEAQYRFQFGWPNSRVFDFTYNVNEIFKNVQSLYTWNCFNLIELDFYFKIFCYNLRK